MKSPKLTKKQKEYNRIYNKKIKLSEELINLHFGKVNNTKCTRCNNKIKFAHFINCRKKFRKSFKIRGSIGDSGISFGLIPKLFSSARPFVVCKKCMDDIYRFMGRVPDIIDVRVFPQHLISVNNPTDLLKSSKKSDSKIHYKKRKYTYTKQKLEQLRKEAVSAYLKKYPYVKFTAVQLFRICKSGGKSQKVGTWN